ncbi:MAG: hypothetical protein V1754_05325, partial [Pseudomonadota bacterium]
MTKQIFWTRAIIVFAIGFLLGATGCGGDGSSGDDGSVQQGDGGTSTQEGGPAKDGTTPNPDQGTVPQDCGNGKVDPGEECDKQDLSGQTCQTLGYTGGTLACDSACKIDKTGCTGTPTGKQFGEKCNGSTECANNMMCVLFNEGGTKEGYCTPVCSETKPCPTFPQGAECAFQLQSGDLICGFLCSASSPICPTGLTCSYSQAGDYYYCTTDAPAVCGNNVIEGFEECDGSSLNN